MSQVEGEYTGSLIHGVYVIEGMDTSEGGDQWHSKYTLQLLPDGSIFGKRDGDINCMGTWDAYHESLQFALTWYEQSYQYQGNFETGSKQISGSWCAKNEALKENTGHFGTFMYYYQHKPNISVNDGNPLDLPTKYQNLLMEHEELQKHTNTMQELIMNLKQDITGYKQEIGYLRQQHANLKMDEQKEDNNDQSFCCKIC